MSQSGNETSLRVLICEDEGLTALRLRSSLTAQGHGVVGSAANGLEAVDLALRLRPDLILMDVNMPGQDGIQAVEQIMRAAPTAVVMLTAHGDPETVGRALAAGASAYLVKPIQDSQLGPVMAVAVARFAQLHQERELTRSLAESYLCRTPVLPGLEVETHYSPAAPESHVGGDYFDFIPLAPDQFGVVVGDVSGSGVEAARLTVAARQMLRAYALEAPSPGEVLGRLNRALCRLPNDDASFLTLVYGVLDTSRFTFTYANGGHPAPLLAVPGSVACAELAPTGGLLGIELGWEWSEAVVSLGPGDGLLLFTDGLVEARRGSQLLGSGPVGRLLLDTIERDVQDVAASIVEEARRFAGGVLLDDVALVSIRRAR